MRVPDSSTSVASAKEIAAKGEADERRYKVIALGVSIAILSAGGIGTIWIQPALAKDVWLFLGPVITSVAYSLNGQSK